MDSGEMNHLRRFGKEKVASQGHDATLQKKALMENGKDRVGMWVVRLMLFLVSGCDFLNHPYIGRPSSYRTTLNVRNQFILVLIFRKKNVRVLVQSESNSGTNETISMGYCSFIFYFLSELA